MKMQERVFRKTKLMFVSPWLLAAAVGLLSLIIVIFAANNIKRERGMLSEGLFRKGVAIIRFVEAGLRASTITSMMGGMMGFSVPGVDGITQMQQLIEQASETPDIHYIAVVDVTGSVIVHSDPEKIGSVIRTDITVLDKAENSTYHIVKYPESKRVFEVVSAFRPFRGQGGVDRWREQFKQQHPPKEGVLPQGELPQDSLHQSTLGSETHPQFILVGLDMTELESTIQRYRYQMIFMSLTLLLIGLGGWISLMAAQGYSFSQEALKRVQAFTGHLISRLPVGIIYTNQEGQIKAFNSAAAKMTDRSFEFVHNNPPESVLPDEVVGFFPDRDNREEMSDRDVHLSGADGADYTLHLSSLPVYDKESHYMGRVLLMYDLTEIKNLEKEIQRHDRLVALGKMAAGVAHEVRNPLSSIKGFATLLGSKFKPGSQEQDAANLLVHEAERLNRSITELLNYARPTTLKKEKINIGELVSASLKLVSSDAQALGVKISHAIDADIPPVDIDRDKINQVMLNLYLNGLQAMEDSADARELKVAVRYDSSENIVVIEVQDSGRGIPPENIEKVLDPYFTTKPEGTGLGLALAYKIIDEHNGTIRLKSTERQGTTVCITLPVE